MSSKAKVILISVVAVVMVVIFSLVLVEGLNKNKYNIRNNTDKNITSLKVYMEDSEESDSVQIGDVIFEGSVNAGSSESGSFKGFDFKNYVDDQNGNKVYVGDFIGELAMLVTFEGEDQIFVYDGVFSNPFDGKIDIEFYQEEGKYWARLSATTGLFKDTKYTELKDDELYFDFEESEFYYADEIEIDEDFDDEESEDDDSDLEDDEEDGENKISPEEGPTETDKAGETEDSKE